MTFSNEVIDEVRNLILDFEVPLRSCVVAILKREYKEEDFENFLKSLIDLTFDGKTNPVSTKELQGKVKELKKCKIYETISFYDNCNKEKVVKDIEGKHFLKVDYLITLIKIFYDPHFVFLNVYKEKFEVFISGLELYRRIRNEESHPGKELKKHEIESLIELISGMISIIPNEYFWYISKEKLFNKIAKLSQYIKTGKVVLTNNLPERQNIIMREKELEAIEKGFIGTHAYSRSASSIELNGYGGVGKTSLALEFCYRLIDKICEGKIKNYKFILWLTSKTEELVLHGKTNDLCISNVRPVYNKSEDIEKYLKSILDLREESSFESAFNSMIDCNQKGIIILDNFENIDAKEKAKIEDLINEFPQNIQFLITSRNYENIGDKHFEINGFKDADGQRFIKKYLKEKNAGISIGSDDAEQLIYNSCGNTLILILCLDRILSNQSTVGEIINDLKIYEKSDMEIITNFMYKNMFNQVVDDIGKNIKDLDFKRFLAIIYEYDETGGIDKYSLKELLKYHDSKRLDELLNMLVSKYILVKKQGYYDFYEFAKKYVVFKFLPNAVKREKIKREVRDYQNNIKSQLSEMYQDRDNDPELSNIFNDWNVYCEMDVLATAMAYKVWKKYRNISLLDEESIKYYYEDIILTFKRIEERSHHPYVLFQKAVCLNCCYKLIKNKKSYYDKEFINMLEGSISDAFDETYTRASQDNEIKRTESYAVFLWLYGIVLRSMNQRESALNIFQSSLDAFYEFGYVRQKSKMFQVILDLISSYAYEYLKNNSEDYLNKISSLLRDVDNRGLYNDVGLEKLRKGYKIFSLFVDAFNNSYIPKNIEEGLMSLGRVPNEYKKFSNSLQEKVFGKVKIK